MLIPVVKQLYTGALAIDTSGYCNHGIPIDITPLLPGFSYDAQGSRVTIAPSQSLSSLECISASVTFSLSPRSSHRYDLLEGFESFALFVNPDLSLSGTIYDATATWTGATSAPNVVTTNVTHLAALECDGINMVRVLLDGAVVGENYNVNGSVRGIGSLGLAVGHWPNPPNVYTFEGVIFGVLLQKYDPLTDLTRGVDPCCFDRQALADWYSRVSKRGKLSLPQLANLAAALKTATTAAAVAIRGGTKADTAAHQALSTALQVALQRRDAAAIDRALQKLLELVTARLDDASRAKLSKDIQAAFAAINITRKDWCDLLDLLCLGLCDVKRRGGAR
jgi:hypothetical protein